MLPSLTTLLSVWFRSRLRCCSSGVWLLCWSSMDGGRHDVGEADSSKATGLSRWRPVDGPLGAILPTPPLGVPADIFSLLVCTTAAWRERSTVWKSYRSLLCFGCILAHVAQTRLSGTHRGAVLMRLSAQPPRGLRTCRGPAIWRDRCSTSRGWNEASDHLVGRCAASAASAASIVFARLQRREWPIIRQSSSCHSDVGVARGKYPESRLRRPIPLRVFLNWDRELLYCSRPVPGCKGRMDSYQLNMLAQTNEWLPEHAQDHEAEGEAAGGGGGATVEFSVGYSGSGSGSRSGRERRHVANTHRRSDEEQVRSQETDSAPWNVPSERDTVWRVPSCLAVSGSTG